MSILIYIIGDYGTIPQILCHPRCITRYSGIFYLKRSFLPDKREQIRILYVQPGKHPEKRFAMNKLRTLQQLVGGDMQAVYPWSKDDVALICNDSGKVDGLPLNRSLEDYDIIAGNFFICGFSGEKFCSLTDKQLRHYEKLFRDPELFLPTPLALWASPCPLNTGRVIPAVATYWQLSHGESLRPALSSFSTTVLSANSAAVLAAGSVSVSLR